MPDLPVLNAQDEQQRAIKGNTAILPETIAQTDTINAANFSMIDKMLGQASGGVYSRLRDLGLSNIEDLLKGGDITDVLRGTAAANLARGVASSGFGRMTALQNSVTAVQANKAAGFSSLERWLASTNAIYKPVGVESMFVRNSVTPQEQMAFSIEERNAKFQHDWVKEQLESQYRMSTIAGQAIVKTDDQLTGMIAGAVGSAAGGGGGM